MKEKDISGNKENKLAMQSKTEWVTST